MAIQRGAHRFGDLLPDAVEGHRVAEIVFLGMIVPLHQRISRGSGKIGLRKFKGPIILRVVVCLKKVQ